MEKAMRLFCVVMVIMMALIGVGMTLGEVDPCFEDEECVNFEDDECADGFECCALGMCQCNYEP